MSEVSKEKILEQDYLDKTLKFIGESLFNLQNNLDERLSKFRASGKEMWENSSHSSNDEDKIPEMNSSLMEFRTADRNFHNSKSELNKYNRAIKSPYFGRFDFVEEGYDDQEQIYIGRFNIMNKKTDDIYVYDWRAPVSSMFYRCEVGKASYAAPNSTINGEVKLKRQYKIEDSKLNYYFDSSTGINDEILQEVLGHNSSSKMKNIVETIQREQDIIIRDIDSDLLIVQGSAGSGKTSIALHRIAFLLYVGLGLKLKSNNIIIISPNSIFSNYISDVLPELGEENVKEITYDEIIKKYLGNEFCIENRSSALESLIGNQSVTQGKNRLNNIKFKGSLDFITILDRFIEYYEHHMIHFQDVYYDGTVVVTKQILKNEFLNNEIKMPMAKRLKRIERRVLYKTHPMREARLAKIYEIVRQHPWHEFQIKSFSRLISIKKSKSTINTIRSFTNVDCFEIYKCFFNKKNLLKKLSVGIELPDNIDDIIEVTAKNLNNGAITFEDSACLLYIKLIVEGDENYDEIRQVVIDEAQDYYPIQYKIFSILFKNARYTVLGDYNQVIEREKTDEIYKEIYSILNKEKAIKLTLKKSYRSSFEISSFAKQFLCSSEIIEAFERHEEEPMLSNMNNLDEMNGNIKKLTGKYYAQGLQSIGIICKTEEQKINVYKKLKNLIKVDMLSEEKKENKGGTVLISSYMAKGLEFDAVIIYDVSDENYNTELDKKLLYIECTRPLHRLAIFYTGEKSRFI
ncbi:HelD family protein [Clostridium akagii]|uniref:HelD family protein n=1 Tax=Clostridium akagii TaxID=91623 RepID=UPI000478D330|nr:UvrD-helicase domain-containing protein [Clostridium akagii]